MAYTAVTWTFRETVTSAKLNLMAANDAYLKTITDGTSVALTPAAGFTGSATAYRFGQWLAVSGIATGTFTAVTTTTVYTLPAGYRPLNDCPHPSIFTNGEFNWGLAAASTGVINARKTTTGSSSLVINLFTIGA